MTFSGHGDVHVDTCKVTSWLVFRTSVSLPHKQAHLRRKHYRVYTTQELSLEASNDSRFPFNLFASKVTLFTSDAHIPAKGDALISFHHRVVAKHPSCINELLLLGSSPT